jgi:hypothetical protein
MATALMIGLKAPERALESVRGSAAPRDCLLALGCLRSRVLASSRLACGNGGRRSGWCRDRRHCRCPTEAGVSQEDAPLYAEGVRRGGTLVSARVPDAGCTRLDAILNTSAVNLRDRNAAWQKTGWKTFDPASRALRP